MKRLQSPLEWFVLAVLVLRPALDLFTDTGLRLGSLNLNPASLLSLALIASAMLWLGTISPEQRGRLRRSPLLLCFALWVGLLSLWATLPLFHDYLWGSPRFIGIREWLRLLSTLMLSVVVLGIAQREGKARVLTALFLSFGLPALAGLYQILFQQGLLVKDVQRIQGTFVHPNPFSFYLVLMLGLTFWAWRTGARKGRWAALLLLELVLQVFTYSFTGAAMLATLVLTLALGENRRLRLLALVFMLLFVGLFLGTPIGRQRLKTELKLEQLDEIERTGRETSSLTWRLLNWRFLYREWKAAPWLGHGLNTSKYINPMLKKETSQGFDPHNDYVRYLAETGAIGLMFFLLFLAGTGAALWRAGQAAPPGEPRQFALMAMAVFAAWLVGSGNDNLITATGYQYALWAVFAVAAATASNPTSSTTGLKT